MQTIGVVLNFAPKIYYYLADEDIKLNDFVIVETHRGVECCKVVKLNIENDSQDKIIRKATPEDIKTNTKNILDAEEVKPKVKSIIEKFKLEMKISKCEYTFDKEKLIIHYTADDRVDFRDLVKTLASEFKSRIEMHQINSRDETQLVGGIGPCGRVCCCKNHLGDFTKVSIKMAKKQGLSLNPQKLNGLCGKMMCCLKYEDEFYTEMLSKMPKVNEKVKTPDGEGVVKSCDCLLEKVVVEFSKGDETEIKSYNLGEVEFNSRKYDE